MQCHVHKVLNTIDENVFPQTEQKKGIQKIQKKVYALFNLETVLFTVSWRKLLKNLIKKKKQDLCSVKK